jgi:hypothetical protein
MSFLFLVSPDAPFVPSTMWLSPPQDNPHDFTLFSPDGRKSVIKIQTKFVPVDIQLAPRESANNMGTLRVELVSGEGLKAGDRNGKVRRPTLGSARSDEEEADLSLPSPVRVTLTSTSSSATKRCTRARRRRSLYRFIEFLIPHLYPSVC